MCIRDSHITARHAGLERCGDLLRDVAHVIGPAQLQAARVQQFDDFGQVCVFALARKYLVANDVNAEGFHAKCFVRLYERYFAAYCLLNPARHQRGFCKGMLK